MGSDKAGECPWHFRAIKVFKNAKGHTDRDKGQQRILLHTGVPGKIFLSNYPVQILTGIYIVHSLRIRSLVIKYTYVYTYIYHNVVFLCCVLSAALGYHGFGGLS